MHGPADGLFAAMLQRGMSRRSFMKFCAATTAALALPATYVPRIAEAVAAAPRIPLIWLRGQACGGDTGALLRAAHPTVAEILLDLVSVDYLDAFMAPAGADAERSRTAAMLAHLNGYLAVVEGAVPTADDGVYCTIGGRAFADIVREVTGGALMTIAVGSCAFDGGLPAAAGGSTGAAGTGAGGFDGATGRTAGGGRLINLPGCPVNVENLTAALVHYLTFRESPAADTRGRPLFAYGGLIHNQCERRAHFEFGEFALAWGDEASQKGWCLYRMGCKGPETFANCPTVRYAEGTSWPIKAGHGCIGCTMPGFWDAMSPFYRRLPSPLPFAPAVSADQVGQAMVGGVAAVTAVHGVASYIRQRRAGRASVVGAAVPIERLEPADAAVLERAVGEPLARVESPPLSEPVVEREPDAGHFAVGPELGPEAASSEPEPVAEPIPATSESAVSPARIELEADPEEESPGPMTELAEPEAGGVIVPAEPEPAKPSGEVE